MELDTLRDAWQTLGRQLERHEALQLALLRERRLVQARSRLRPLWGGQLLQILLLGLPCIALALWLWLQSFALPAHVIVAGIVVHAYGVAVTALAGATLARIGGIDPAAPVLAIQTRLAQLRKLYLINGRIVGLSWWLLWVPVLMTLAAIGGADLMARAPRVVGGGLGVGVTGLAATWGFHRWSRAPSRAALGQRMEDIEAGSSLRRAQAELDDLVRFGQECAVEQKSTC